MFLDLNKIGPEGLRFERNVPLTDLEGPGGGRVVVAASRLVGAVTKAARGFDFEARLDATVEVACCRCLEPVRIRIDTDVVLVLVPTTGETPSGEGDDEEATRFDCPEGRVDLAHLVEEQIDLALPLKPVCGEECRGLCPRCGTNRNVTACGCTTEETDPRLEPLRKLRKRETS